MFTLGNLVLAHTFLSDHVSLTGALHTSMWEPCLCGFTHMLFDVALKVPSTCEWGQVHAFLPSDHCELNPVVTHNPTFHQCKFVTSKNFIQNKE